MKILITGASKGIGFFLFQKFHADGYEVYGTYNSTSPGVEYEKFFTKVDMSVEEEILNWITRSVNSEDQIVLINCASANYNVIARKANPDKWGDLIDVNLVGTFRAINALLPLMHEKGFGRIINLSSVLSQRGVAGTSAYAASKAALAGMAKTIAVENAKNNITINNLNLGYFNIGMTLNDIPADVLEGIKAQIPMQKLGDPENIYNAVKFLISSDYITGTSIDINGGLY